MPALEGEPAAVEGRKPDQRVDVQRARSPRDARRRSARRPCRPSRRASPAASWRRGRTPPRRSTRRRCRGTLDPDLVDGQARGCPCRGSPRRAASASSASFASLIPPALPRPPIWTWALTTTGKPSASAASRASSGVRRDAVRHGYAVLGEKLFSLVFEKIHRRRRLGICPGRTALRPARHAISKANGGKWLYPRTRLSSAWRSTGP